MPIYEYRCDDCERSFDVLTSFGDRDRGQICPSCESRKTRVLVSSFASIGGSSEFSSTLPMAPSGGGCCRRPPRRGPQRRWLLRRLLRLRLAELGARLPGARRGP